MRLVDAFFANAVEISPDGRCFVLGGGIEGLAIPHLGIAVPSIAMLARIHFETRECNLDHWFRLRVISPEGQDLGVEANIEFRPPPNEHFREMGVITQVSVVIHGLPLNTAGLYRFDLAIDAQIIGYRTLGVAVLEHG